MYTIIVIPTGEEPYIDQILEISPDHFDAILGENDGVDYLELGEVDAWFLLQDEEETDALPLNRLINNKEIIHGPMFLCGRDQTSLSDHAAEKWLMRAKSWMHLASGVNRREAAN